MTETKRKCQLKHSIVLLRVLIGWHFLYEGVIKLYNRDWTSFGYLATAQGPLEPLFLAIAKEPMIGWADTLNWLALMFVGITFLLGIFEKKGALVGILLLALYYLAHPAFPWLQQVNVEGSYWFINKNLIELAACLVIYQFPTGQYFGLTNLFNKDKEQTKTETL